MARDRISSLDGRGIADFDELIRKRIHRILRSCLIALYFDATTLIEIAVNERTYHQRPISYPESSQGLWPAVGRRGANQKKKFFLDFPETEEPHGKQW